MSAQKVYSVSAVLVAGLSFAAPAWSQQKAKPAQSGIVGSWSGSVQQAGRTGSYAMLLTVTETGGVTSYPSLKCEGKLTRVGSADGYTFFTETITKGGVAQGGNCINGSITVLSAGERLAWGWVGADRGAVIVASSTLVRK